MGTQITSRKLKLLKSIIKHILKQRKTKPTKQLSTHKLKRRKQLKAIKIQLKQISWLEEIRQAPFVKYKEN